MRRIYNTLLVLLTLSVSVSAGNADTSEIDKNDKFKSDQKLDLEETSLLECRMNNEDLNELIATLQETSAQCDTNCSIISSGDNSEDVIESLREQIKKQTARVTEKMSDLRNLRQDKRQVNKQLRKCNKQQQITTKQLESKVQEKEAALVAATKQVLELQTKMNQVNGRRLLESEQTIKNLEQKCHDKDETIASLRHKCEENNHTNCQIMEQKLTDHDQIIMNLREKILEKDQKIINLSQKGERKDETTKNLREQTEEEDKVNDRVKQELKFEILEKSQQYKQCSSELEQKYAQLNNTIEEKEVAKLINLKYEAQITNLTTNFNNLQNEKLEIAETLSQTSAELSDKLAQISFFRQEIRNLRIESTHGCEQVNKTDQQLQQEAQQIIAKEVIVERYRKKYNLLCNKTEIMKRACVKNDPDVVVILLDLGVNIESPVGFFGSTCLHQAAENSNIEFARMLLSRGAKVDPKDMNSHTPLMWASVHGRLENVKLLLEHGADINLRNVDHLTALGLAKKKNRSDVIRFLNSINAPQ